jgi:uncharacterized DUF497 family protein
MYSCAYISAVVTWDPKKAAANRRKHGIAFADAQGALEDPLAISVEDEDADRAETRFYLIGTDYPERVIVVAYAHDGDDVRMISARPATAKERKQYEE